VISPTHQFGTLRRRGYVAELEAPKLTVHVAPVTNPHDHFLACVAPLRLIDGPFDDPCFRWNRLFVHVGPEDRTSRLDPERRPNAQASRTHTLFDQGSQ
jgi:hypothetical protein